MEWNGMKALLASWFELSDEQAMWRVQTQDDEDAFAQLMHRWEEPIRRLCVRMLGDEHKASDICQEAFTRIYNKRKDYQHNSKFSTFLWRVAMNLCLDELRRIKRRAEFSLVSAEGEDEEGTWNVMPAEEKTPCTAVQASETAEIVQRALRRLPEHYQTVVVLKHYQNLKFREIADVLDIPEGTVKSRMAEALSILGKMLRDQKPPLPKTDPTPRNHRRFETIL